MVSNNPEWIRRKGLERDHKAQVGELHRVLAENRLLRAALEETQTALGEARKIIDKRHRALEELAKQ